MVVGSAAAAAKTTTTTRVISIGFRKWARKVLLFFNFPFPIIILHTSLPRLASYAFFLFLAVLSPSPSLPRCADLNYWNSATADMNFRVYIVMVVVVVVLCVSSSNCQSIIIAIIHSLRFLITARRRRWLYIISVPYCLLYYVLFIIGGHRRLCSNSINRFLICINL